MATLVERAREGDFAAASAEHFALWPWMHAAFVESNPIPVKAALSFMGRIRNVLREPLLPLAAANEPMVRRALQKAGAL
jgi:4-hydroxy-tetrahydrodipicolinate synthase